MQCINNKNIRRAYILVFDKRWNEFTASPQIEVWLSGHNHNFLAKIVSVFYESTQFKYLQLCKHRPPAYLYEKDDYPTYFEVRN